MAEIPDRLPDAPWMTAASTLAVVAALEAEGGADVVRYVGGCVRDTLLGRPAALEPVGGGGAAALDIDLCTPLEPPRVVRALERAGLKAVPTGIAHGTVTAVSGGRPYEITTLRRDVETDGRHAVVAFTDDWAEDAARRDFRLNALYAAPDGRLFDPTGGGIADALAGRVRFVGDPARRIGEDHLRTLRFFRFSAWYGQGPLDPEGLAACAELKAGVRTLSAERVSKELLKLLGAPDPLPVVQAMAESGVLAELPLDADVGRLARLFGVERALGQIGAEGAVDAGLRLAALATRPAGPLAAALRLPNALRDRLEAAAGPFDLEAVLASPAEVKRGVYDLGLQAWSDRARLAAGAEDAGRLGPALDMARAWRRPALPLDGTAIKAAGVRQGPDVGRVRSEVEREWADAGFPDDPRWLGERLRAAVARLGG